MGYWDGRAADKENLRLFDTTKKWRRYEDEKDANDVVTEEGCARILESTLINGLNSTNLLVLTGAGSSFCVKNAASSKVTSKTAPGLKDLWDAVKTKVGDLAFDGLIGLIPNGSAIGDIEKLLTQCKLYVALYGGTVGNGKIIADFVTNAENAILARVDFVDADTDLTAHQALLRKMARRGIRKPRVRVFTTNYDLSFEYAARGHRFVVIDGFSHAAPSVYDQSHFGLDIVRRDNARDAPDYLDSVFHLYKLHGSIDWRRTPTDIVRARDNSGTPVLIYPRDSKYQEAFEPPYLDMTAALQSALREPDTALFVAGFSFNDSHIAQPIMSALESNMGFRIIVCDPAFLDDAAVDKNPVTVAPAKAPTNPIHKKLVKLAEAGDERITLLHGRFEDLALALPDLVAETERERHAQRMRTLREVDAKTGASKP
jgi:hypothetical protein